MERYYSMLIAGGVTLVVALAGSQVLVVCLNMLGAQLVLNRGQQVNLQRRYHGARDLVLHFEDIREFAIERLGPKVIAGIGANELCSDSQFVAGLADTAFEYVRDTQLRSNLLELFGPSLHLEGRSPRDDPQARRLPEQLDQLLR